MDSSPGGGIVSRHNHDPAQPLNLAVQTDVRNLFPLYASVRSSCASIAYKLNEKTAFHGGVFNDIISAQVADFGAMNSPYVPVFVGGIKGQAGGVGIASGVPGSAADATVQADQSFQTLF
jgi:hypothetical protein